MKFFFTLNLLFLVIGLSACQSGDDDELVIYSGRSKALVESLAERYEEETGQDVEIRYGTDAQLLATLQEEGERSPADLFWANTAGALGAASNANLLTRLPDSLLEQPVAYVPSGGLWTPVTTRFRVLAYNPQQVDSTALPASVMNLPQMNQYAGRIGWTPNYSSFQDFITAMRLRTGRDSTLAWLEGMQALNPKSYGSNSTMLQALVEGEIDLALTNHYYVLRMKYDSGEGESGEAERQTSQNLPLATYHFASGDVGNLALVTGAGLLETSQHPEAARQFLGYLLSLEAQRYAAQSVHEYPVVTGVQQPGYLMPVEQAARLSPTFDFEQLRDLEGTLNLLREAGLL